jgi:hypothetical protein
MHRLIAAGYVALGVALLVTGQRSGAAAFVVIGIAWFALSFTRFADRSAASK